MRLTHWPYLAAISLIGFAALLEGATRPRYGGVLRAEMEAAVARPEPAPWPAGQREAAAKSRIAELLFDRLVHTTETGGLQPALALSWRPDAERKRWEFRLRPGVKFHDGSILTAAHVVDALKSENAPWKASVFGETLILESDHTVTDLPWELAQPRYSIFRPGPDGVPIGTGPFRIMRWESGRRAVMAAHNDYWEGRPYLDSIEIQMGRPLREQLIDLELDRADLVEIGPGEVRRAREIGTRILSSAPSELMGLVFRRGTAVDERLRAAIAQSLDRAAMHGVLLQKQGEIAAGLLPQWLSGYAFLFSSPQSPDRTRVSSLPALTLAVESDDAIARSIADRAAVDARTAGVNLRVTPASNAAQLAKADLSIVRVPITSVKPSVALIKLAAALGLADPAIGVSLASVHAAERALLQDYRVIPLFHLPATYGSSGKVQSWMSPMITRTGGWRLQDAWLEARQP